MYPILEDILRIFLSVYSHLLYTEKILMSTVARFLGRFGNNIF